MFSFSAEAVSPIVEEAANRLKMRNSKMCFSTNFSFLKPIIRCICHIEIDAKKGIIAADVGMSEA